MGRPEKLSRRELLHLRQTSADIWKTVPLLVIFALPTIGAVAAAFLGYDLDTPVSLG